jgi:hypothetical protein
MASKTRKKKFRHAPQREEKLLGMVHQQPQRDFQFVGHGNFSCSDKREENRKAPGRDHGDPM